MDAKAVQKKGKTDKADQGLAFIQKLYALEKVIKEQPPDERYRRRQQEAKQVIDKLRAWSKPPRPIRLNPYNYLKTVFKKQPNAQSVEAIETLLFWNVNTNPHLS